ncbi:MAG TPA: hypothetical protein VKX17_03390 [Planctomycetota bacterium]|nr:hypothetical protein [Planctomycetota bacterium]
MTTLEGARVMWIAPKNDAQLLEVLTVVKAKENGRILFVRSSRGAFHTIRAEQVKPLESERAK